MTLSEIYIYPIKSLSGIKLNEALVEERGLQHDRRWLLINTENQFLSQRSNAEMALIDVQISETGLKVQHRQKASLGVLEIPFQPQTSTSINVTVWDDTISATIVNEASNNWFSEALGSEVRLAFMPNSSLRPADSKYAPFENNVSFADGYPYLVIGQSSLDDLNNRLDNQISMLRFRPNFVVTGGLPYEEDHWYEFEIGNLSFLGVKPCARCVMPTIDPETALKGKEPLLTLNSYRKLNNKIFFGQNVLAKNYGTLKVGDDVKILSRKIRQTSSE